MLLSQRADMGATLEMLPIQLFLYKKIPYKHNQRFKVAFKTPEKNIFMYDITRFTSANYVNTLRLDLHKGE